MFALVLALAVSGYPTLAEAGYLRLVHVDDVRVAEGLEAVGAPFAAYAALLVMVLVCAGSMTAHLCGVFLPCGHRR